MSKATQPLVSVLMTAYNRERYIAEAIESVLASSYKNFELIIVDDNSKDRTYDIGRLYLERDHRIRLYQNEKNLGDYKNRNKAASFAEGEFIMFVDSDDKINLNGIELCIKGLQKFLTASFAMYWSGCCEGSFLISKHDAISQHFFEKPFLTIGPGGTIIRTDFFRKIGGYPSSYGPANDMYFNLKACCFSDIVMLPFEFMYYRRHTGQEINNSYSYLFNNYLYLKDAIEGLPLNLDRHAKAWILKKNKRRFVVNLVRYFFSTLDLRKTIEAKKRANFSFLDAVEGIFHFN